MNLRIDPEFKDYLGALDGESRQALEESLMAEGCRDALVVWPQADGDPILLDGHNRYEICVELDISYRVVECPAAIADRESAVAWIVQNQRARRNLTKTQLTYLIGMAYKTAKEVKGGDRGNQYTVAMDQNDPLPKTTTAERMAEEFGVSAPTVKRAERIADAINDIAAQHGQEAKTEILAGRKKVADYVPAEPARPILRDDGDGDGDEDEGEWYLEQRPLPWGPPLVPPVDPESLPKTPEASGGAVFLKLCDVYRTVAQLAQYPKVDARNKVIIRKQARLLIETVENLLKELC